MALTPRGRVAVLAAASLGALAAGAGAAAPASPSCTVTSFVVAGVGPAAAGLAMASPEQSCWGPYVFFGASPTSLGFPASATDDGAELAALLRGWSTADGAPAVDRWVSLAPAVTTALRVGGVDPVRFLQWVNEYDGAGTAARPALPPTWPPFLPRALVRDPRQALLPAPGGAASSGSAAPAAAGPGQAAAQPPPGWSAGPPAAGAAPAAAPGGSAAGAQPPSRVLVGGVDLPCVVASACRVEAEAYARWRGLPWYRRAALTASRRRWWLAGGLALAAALACALRMGLLARRNLRWYGDLRGPR